MNAIVKDRSAVPTLKDSRLFRDRAYVDGAWVEADSKQRLDVDNPADGNVLGSIPDMGRAETKRAIAAAEAALPAWRGLPAKERSKILRKWYDLIMANVEDLAQLMTAGAGQAARRVARRDRVRGVVHRVVRRGGQARLRRRDPEPHQRPAPDRAEAADRRVRRDHAVELPQRDDHTQGRAGARRRLHLRAQARRADAVLGAGAGRAGRARRHPEGRVQRRDRRPAWPSARSLRANPVVRKVTFTGSTEVGRILMRAVRRHHQEALARAGRQRALHRVRRRRPGRRGRRRARLQVPQRGPDLRVRQPHLRAGRRLRRVRRQAHREGEGDEGRATAPSRAWCTARSSTSSGSRRSRSTWPTRSPRAPRSCWAASARALGGRFYEPTVLTGVTATMKVAREETFGPVAPLFRFKDDAEAITHGQRHRVRPVPPTSTRATSGASSASPRRSSPAWSASTWASSPTRWRRSAA